MHTQQVDAARAMRDAMNTVPRTAIADAYDEGYEDAAARFDESLSSTRRVFFFFGMAYGALMGGALAWVLQ